jgi:hypothetical protein
VRAPCQPIGRRRARTWAPGILVPYTGPKDPPYAVESLPEKQTERWRACSRVLGVLGRWWGGEWQRNDSLLYALFAASCTAYVAAAFYGYMLLQTRGQWSAPLDDVFIHFDYGRSFARGYPFQWSEGNGYSSGNTSLTYPLVLGVGSWLGLRELDLMAWAAGIACLGVLGFLYLGRHLLGQRHGGLAPWVKYLLPPAVLSWAPSTGRCSAGWRTPSTSACGRS